MPGVSVRKVEDDQNFRSGDMRVFFEFPWTVYKNDPNWVPPLLSFRRNLLTRSKNPAWEYLEGEFYVAWRGDKPVGTIAAFINKLHNKTWDEKLGWFGFFECFDDQEAATALLKAASDYALKQGMTALRGPANFSVNDECALLIENFEPPLILMPYNPPYYQKLIESSGLGLTKIMDLESWHATPEMLRAADYDVVTQKLRRVVEKTKQRYNVTIRRPTLATLKDDLQALQQVYTTAWQKNWGMIPPTEKEVEHLFADLKDYYDPTLACFAEMNGQLVAFLLGLPDMNQVLIKAYARPGTPEIITLLKAAWYWKIRPRLTGKHTIIRERVLLFGVKPEFRLKGIDAAMLLDIFEKLVNHPTYKDNDGGWFLETNQPILQIMSTLHTIQYKRYRFYQRPLTPGLPGQ